MNLRGLIDIVRNRTDDTTVPYLVSDLQLTAYANHAERLSCEGSGAIYDDTTPSVCQISITSGTATYPLHPSILTLYGNRARFNTRPIHKIQQHDLDSVFPNWENSDPSCVSWFIIGQKSLTLYPTPDEDGTLYLRVYRYPLESMDDDADEPEIDAEHHRYLAHWMTYEVASMWDESRDGSYDPKLAATELALFERRFGIARSATEIRSWRELPRLTRARSSLIL